MDFAEYVEVIQSPSTRHDRYADMVRTYYDFATDVYRQLWGESFHLTWFTGEVSLEEAQAAQQRRLADEGGWTKGARILDVGCGVGGPAMQVARYAGVHVTGVNISPLQVAIANEKYGDAEGRNAVDFVVGDAMRLPFPNESFDGAMSVEAICHVPDKAQVYSEIGRILRPEGTFAGYDWFAADGVSPEEYEEFVEPICRYCALPGLISLADLKRTLGASGFEATAVSQYSDHGDLRPLWSYFDTVGSRLESAPELAVLEPSLQALRRGVESGHFVLGCWTARKTADQATMRAADAAAV
jgi:SAM-dependent methyltransferase